MASQTASTASRAPRQERGRLRVAALLRAGEEVINDRGYANATMTEIAARAGAAIGSLYQFFPTKEAIADAIRAQLADALGEALAGLEAEAHQANADFLGHRLFDTFLGYLREHPALMAIAEARGAASSGVPDTRARLRGHLAGILSAYAPRARKRDIGVTAIVSLQLMRSAATLAAEGVSDLPRALAAIEELLVESIRRLT